MSFSVVIPVKTIDAAAIAQLAQQATKAGQLNFIAVGGCTAAASSVLPPNLQIIDRDCSIYEAMNVGLESSANEYALFMGIDDQLILDGLPSFEAALMAMKDAALIVFPVRVGSRLVRQQAKSRLSAYHHQGVLFRRSLALAAGGYSLIFRLHSDLDLMFAMQTQGSVASISEPLVIFRKGGLSTSGRHSALSAREFNQIYKKHRVSRACFNFLFSMALLLKYKVRYWVVNASQMVMGRK